MLIVPISEFRSKMPEFIKKINRGVKIVLTSHGKVVAEITSPLDQKKNLRERLEYLRRHIKLGDVVSPTGEKWEAQD